jgi:hypothetical protein
VVSNLRGGLQEASESQKDEEEEDLKSPELGSGSINEGKWTDEEHKKFE